MVLNATFHNILSLIEAEETGVPGENHRPAASHYKTNFITQCCIEYTSPEQDSNSQRQW
jgi:hypothetical protein